MVAGRPPMAPSFPDTHHPEIELSLFSPRYVRQLEALANVRSSVGILEITENAKNPIFWDDDMRHEDLVGHVKMAMDLRLIRFLNALHDKAKSQQNPTLGLSTIEWLRSHFGLSEFFLEAIVNTSRFDKIGDGCIAHRDDALNSRRLDILYRMGGIRSGACHVWSSHDSHSKSADYVIYNCPPDVQQRIVRCAQGSGYRSLLRPLAVDIFIADQCMREYREKLENSRRPLIEYEKHGASELPNEALSRTYETLHRLSQSLHILSSDFADLDERLQFLQDIYPRLLSHRHAPSSFPVTESIVFLRSRIATLRRWTINYTDRSKTRIDLFFHLSQQTDSKTNLLIARTSTRIAEATRRDSASMITLAILTMIFLPGTFTSAFFSMPFFSYTATSTEEQGLGGDRKMVFTVGTDWWLYPATTLPLTAVVFGVWGLWLHLRRRNQASGGKQVDSFLAGDGEEDEEFFSRMQRSDPAAHTDRAPG